MLSDCYPAGKDTYDAFSVSGEKYEPRGKPPNSLELFVRCTKQHIAIWRILFGSEHAEERLAAMRTLGKLHEAHPDLRTLSVIVSAWGETTYRYINEVKEGAMEMV